MFSKEPFKKEYKDIKAIAFVVEIQSALFGCPLSPKSHCIKSYFD